LGKKRFFEQRDMEVQRTLEKSSSQRIPVYLGLQTLGLKQVPLVAVEVFEDGNGAVWFLARGLEEFDFAGLHEAIVAPEIVGVEKEEDASTCLFANAPHLIRSGRLREEELWTGGARRGDQKPALAPGEGGVFDDGEAQGASEEG
jgi:hypothetical protein